MIFILNVIAMLATIAFGMIGWLAPTWTMEKLHLKVGQSNRGLSEIRAANGALFVGVAAAALFIALPLAFAMVGFLYAGAAVGRLTSILVDGSGDTTTYSFLAAEVVLAAFLIWANFLAVG